MRAVEGGAAAQSGRIPLLVIGAFGSVGLPLAALLVTFTVYLPRYLVALGVPFASVGATIAIVRLLDVGLDPLIGYAMDQTRTAIGRYRPWQIAGAPILMVGLYKLTSPPAHIDIAYLVFWLFFTYVGYSVLALGTAAWGAVLATNYSERSRLYGLTQSLAVLGTVLLLLLPVFTKGRVVPGNAASMPIVGWLIIVAIPITVAICVTATPERMQHSEARTKFRLSDYRLALLRPTMMRLTLACLAVSLGASATAPIYVYFFKDAKGFSIAETSLLLIFYIGAGVAGAPFWGHLARSVNKHKTMQIACCCYAVCQTVLMALPRMASAHHSVAAVLPTAGAMFAVGFSASAFQLLARAMVADVVDEVRLESGKDLNSQLYAVITTMEKIGVAAAISIIFPILQFVGYDGHDNAVNTPQAIFGLEMCYLFAPIILVLIGGVLLFGYRLNSARHAQIRAELAEREVGAALETISGPLPETVELES